MSITVRINGVSQTLAENTAWTDADYANAFKAAFQPYFPTLTFTVSAEGRLVVEAPKGAPLSITSSGDSFTPGVDVRSTSATDKDPVIVVIKSGVAEQTYRLSLNGQNFTYTSGTSDQASTWRTEVIASAFRNQLVAAGYVVKQYGQVLTIRKADNSLIKFDYSDTWNNQAMYAAKGRVAATTDLPPRLDTDVVLAIGDVRSGGYYLRFAYREPSADGSGFTYSEPSKVSYDGSYTGFTAAVPTVVSHTDWQARESGGTGVYEETYRPGARTSFSADTMPHVLVREANGSFTFKQANWGVRKVGDEQSVPAPSFVGKRVNDVFFFRNRLGFLTDENVVLSKAGLFFDFWPDTAKEVLDSDPIDLLVSSTKVSILRYAEPFHSNLLVFGDTAQWVVTAQGAMTPRTVNIQPSTSFECSKSVRPVSVGQTVYFAAEKAQWSSVWEYYVLQDAVQNTAQEVTQHVPRYIPSGIRQVIGSPSENLVVALTAGQKQSMFVYKYLWVNDQKVQESWSRWTFSGEVVNAAFMGSMLYIAFKHGNEGLYLEKIDLQDPTTDSLVDRRGHANWKPYTMVYELSPVYLRGNQGQNLLGSKEAIRTMKVYYTHLDYLKVAVGHPYRPVAVRVFPDTTRLMPYRSSSEESAVRVSVGGDARKARIAFVNDSPGQCQIQAIEFELMSNQRAQRV